MPVCVICNADGVVAVNDAWYCIEHVDEAFYELGRIAALVLHWPEEVVVDALSNWLVFSGYYAQEVEDSTSET